MFQQLGYEEEDESVCHEAHGCQNLVKDFASERFLTTAGQSGENRTRFKSPDLSKNYPNNEDELFHVLVTKPEIAGKPRDNIIFEGDMDLKTTFETTYEALAKLRLAHWKKYQELRTGKEDKSACKKQRLKQISQTIDDYDDNHQEQDVSSDNKHQQSASDESLINGEQLGVAELAGSNVNSNDVDPEMCAPSVKNNSNDLASPLTTAAITQAALTTTTTTTTSTAGSERPLQATGKCPLHSMRNTVNNNDCCSPTTELRMIESSPVPCCNSRCSNNNNNNNNNNNTSYHNNYIDPDLSIIVYDANLNRLERLGLRKRSKYRPSTSLRPGAKGFFGDQEEQKSRLDHEGDKTYQQDSVCCYSTCKEIEAPFDSTSPVHQHFNSEDIELSPAEQAMSARNLMSSQQGFNLLYSNQNLPIDSKRRCKDNVNLIDHIKEQNIVEHHLEQIDTNKPKQQQQQQQQHYQCTCLPSFQSEHQDTNDDQLFTKEEWKNQAEQEEAAAVEEIKLITSNPIDETHSEQAVEYVRDAESRADDDLRQSKLRRTCQNQNFSIYNNDYRDASVGRDGISNKDPEVKKLSTRMSPKSTNLFKESSSVFS